jgi:hypothetical protein
LCLQGSLVYYFFHEKIFETWKNRKHFDPKSVTGKQMENIKKTIKESIPPKILRPISEAWDGFQRSLQFPSAYLHPWRRKSITKLNTIKDKYSGERCFIIGNGPSLKVTDVSKLQNEFTFGMNRIYLAFENWGFQTSFLVCINSLVIEQVYQDFHRLSMPKFFSWRSRKLLYPSGQPDEDTHFLFTTYTGPHFSPNAASRMWEGATVTFACLQLAFHMGFQEAILIGVDHSFAAKGLPNTTIESQGDDQSHFDTKYFGKDFRWQLPDLDTSERGYWLARQAFEQDGRKVIDATIGGKLQVFPKTDYESLF